jgi:hypothetical protein
MRIVDIRELSVPISRYADPSVPSGGLTTSAVAVITDVNRDGNLLSGTALPRSAASHRVVSFGSGSRPVCWPPATLISWTMQGQTSTRSARGRS